jgi:hypothetical protein
MNNLNDTKVSYCGLKIIDNSSLLKVIAGLGKEWQRIAHHVTIKLGELPIDLKDKKGTIFPMTATHIGRYDNKVFAVKVEVDIKTYNAFAHITLAINNKTNGKPVMSNHITSWTPIKNIKLEGKILEFNNAGNEI